MGDKYCDRQVTYVRVVRCLALSAARVLSRDVPDAAPPTSRFMTQKSRRGLTRNALDSVRGNETLPQDGACTALQAAILGFSSANMDLWLLQDAKKKVLVEDRQCRKLARLLGAADSYLTSPTSLRSRCLAYGIRIDGTAVRFPIHDLFTRLLTYVLNAYYKPPPTRPKMQEPHEWNSHAGGLLTNGSRLS
ncbi:hypothetical protein P154DRAFT_568877 [Amniculicola lignicola CBS 123094]|uniref:Uncharacterized protein n=1 Tax=Amniculicola lignicola CBS 123094 TaxID=1392246 RepID=A0A6A5X590_9PLEO|nr:hypothetical protein P154DRAFT_568877 [Amniculicola lignicola CBS 123094]